MLKTHFLDFLPEIPRKRSRKLSRQYFRKLSRKYSTKLSRKRFLESFLKYFIKSFLEFFLESFLEYFLESFLVYFLESFLEYFLESFQEYFVESTHSRKKIIQENFVFQIPYEFASIIIVTISWIPVKFWVRIFQTEKFMFYIFYSLTRS